MKTEIYPGDIMRAKLWLGNHREHVDRLLSADTNPLEHHSYPPTGSDICRPELWRAPQWRWLLKTYGENK